jgi:hypothetical protein
VRPYGSGGSKNPFRSNGGGGASGNALTICILVTLLFVCCVMWYAMSDGSYLYTMLHAGAGGHAAKQFHYKNKHKKQQAEIEEQREKRRAMDSVKIMDRHKQDNGKDDKAGRDTRQWNKDEEASADDDVTGQQLALDENGIPSEFEQFPTLAKAMARAELVAVYFASKWCPDSTPVTQKLMELFPDQDDIHEFTLLLPDDLSKPKPDKKADLAIVYVSSDHTEKQMMAYGSSKNWIRVPFSEPNLAAGEDLERTQLKRHFYTSAANEQEPLEVERKHGIPHLLVIGEGRIITHHGADDIKEYGRGSLQQWKELLVILHKLSGKFDKVDEKVNPVTS